MSSFTDRCEQEDEADRLALVLAYDRGSDQLLGQVCPDLPQDRPGFLTVLSAAGYSAVHMSTISIEEVQ